MREFADIWTYLAETPLIWLSAALVAYVIGDALAVATGRSPLVNPVLLAGLLWISATPYPVYFERAQFVHFLLEPATVALAVPLHTNLSQVRRAALPILAALVAGSLTAVISALLIARPRDQRCDAGLAGAKKRDRPGCFGYLGHVGRIADPYSGSCDPDRYRWCGGCHATAERPADLGLARKGVSTGVAAHGIGTARAFHVNERAGAFAGIGMGVNAILTALIAPYVLKAVM